MMKGSQRTPQFFSRVDQADRALGFNDEGIPKDPSDDGGPQQMHGGSRGFNDEGIPKDPSVSLAVRAYGLPAVLQ